ncbi:MAG: outer membrane beta-barrel protein [Pseudomonadota bacterium]
MNLRIMLTIGMVALMALPSGALSEDNARRQDPDSRSGYRLGGFVIQPELSLGVGYNTNILLSDTGETASGFVIIAPSVRIDSDWNRHALRLEAGGEAGVFTHDMDDAYLDGKLALTGQIDVLRSFWITLDAGIEHGHEARGGDDVPGLAAEPVRFLKASGGLSAELRVSPMRVRPYVAVRRFDYSDVDLIGGGQSNQDDRDRTEMEAGAELGFRISRAYEVFIRSSLLATDYVAAVDDNGANRDSLSFSGSAGLRVRLSRLLEGVASAGVVYRQFDDVAFSDGAEVEADLELTWRPTPRLEFSAALSRGFRESTVATAGDVIDSEVSIEAAYELTRRLKLRASGGYAHADFRGADQTEMIARFGIGADWEARRGLTLSPGYEFSMRTSDIAGRDYVVHQVMINADYKF